MTRSLRIQYPGAFYHVTSRGNERKEVFRSFGDRERFLTYLDSATERYGAVIHVYCLMNTHYHLFIETPSANLSKIMQHINGAYTAYFNRRWERSGHLFQGRYKAIVVEADEYAMELSRYVHLNPVRAGIVEKPEEYEWSSFRYYISNGNIPRWLKRDFILGYFDREPLAAMNKYRGFVHALLDKDYKSPLTNLTNSLILGSNEFVDEIKDRFITDREPERELPILTEMADRPGLEAIEEAVDSVLRNDPRLSRQVKMFLCHRYSGKKLAEIGTRYGVGESAVTQASRRLRYRQQKDKKLRELLLEISGKVTLSNV